MKKLIVAALGPTLCVLSFVGIHVTHPSGQPELMTDSQMIHWVESGAHGIWFGGALSVIAALLLMAWISLLADRLESWSATPLARRLAMIAASTSTGLLALGGLLQISAGILGTPEEHIESASLLPVVTMLYGYLGVSAWCLLAVPACAVLLSAGAPHWLRLASALPTLGLLASLALPPISWGPAFLWVLVVSVPLATSRDVT